ncbi:acyltransferase domain-containing protein [Ruania alba]|uniref:Predicted phosphohydrolase, Cof family, HAD superfamily n=1 Tax=Ruania alba TaxID=648782 RepID=A0A1H5KSY9_9MICO|nr:acyltransferase domain-containing protein [Ruania alba]SEE67935.1 Predicted phosphohydrolase, Cof family, HAD superfamily [Ruania alba]
MTLSPTQVRARLAAPDLPETLALLGFTDADARDMLALCGRLLDDPAAIDRIAELAGLLHERVGDVTREIAGEVWQLSDGRPGEPDRALAALLVTVPEVRAFHRSRGISDAISWRSLADLGQQVAVHRLTFGEFGIHTHGWVLNAWAGGLYWLGRLQYTFERTDEGLCASAHIPRTGSLAPAAVDASFARVGPFFARHFPDHPLVGLHCMSWLLDPQLAEVLPERSNIVAFGTRWELTGHSQPGNADVLFFVFARRGQVDLEALPAESSLQRGVLAHLRGGGEWRTCAGVAPLPIADGGARRSGEVTSADGAGWHGADLAGADAVGADLASPDLARPGAEVPESLVRQFHEVYQVPMGAEPSLASQRVPMRMALIAEEAAELVAAVYGTAAGEVMDEAYARAVTLDDGARDVVEAADAIGDLIYVLYGMALECGIPLADVLAEIQGSNLSKLGADGRPILREDGKVLKGPGYYRPDIAAVLARRGWSVPPT